jgi:hypothetical protein
MKLVRQLSFLMLGMTLACSAWAAGTPNRHNQFVIVYRMAGPKTVELVTYPTRHDTLAVRGSLIFVNDDLAADDAADRPSSIMVYGSGTNTLDGHTFEHGHTHGVCKQGAVDVLRGQLLRAGIRNVQLVFHKGKDTLQVVHGSGDDTKDPPQVVVDSGTTGDPDMTRHRSGTHPKATNGPKPASGN